MFNFFSLAETSSQKIERRLKYMQACFEKTSIKRYVSVSVPMETKENLLQQKLESISALIKIKSEIIDEINTLSNKLYSKQAPMLVRRKGENKGLSPEENQVWLDLKAHITNYLLMQKVYISALNSYRRDNKKEYWQGVGNPEQIEEEFNRFLSLCDFSKMQNEEKAISYIFQNFQQETSRELLNQIYLRSNELGTTLIFTDQEEDRDEAKPVAKEGENVHEVFAHYKQELSLTEEEKISKMDLKEFIEYLKENTSTGDTSILESMKILIPATPKLSFCHAYFPQKNQPKIECCFLDFARLNMHEFGHVLAYLEGNCLDPEGLFIPPNLGFMYSNVEELRNLLISEFSENNNDRQGPQRIGHKGIYQGTLEELQPTDLSKEDFLRVDLEDFLPEFLSLQSKDDPEVSFSLT
jgi:hypothetical protein